MLPKVMFSWKSQLICSSITNLHSNVCNFYSSIWLRYLSIDVFLNDNIQINTTFHFSFPFRLIFLSIDFFINQSVHLRPTYYFSLFLLIFFSISKHRHMQLYIEESIDIWINSNWPFCQFHFERRLIFLSIIDININKIAFCSTKV